MAKASQATCSLTADELLRRYEPRAPRATVSGGLRYLAHCTPEERAEALARIDAAFAAGKHKQIADDSILARVAVPKERIKLYLTKRLEAVIFEVLEDRRVDRGTMRATTDGSLRRAFNFRTKDMIIEPESSETLILAGIPRGMRRWVNETFPAARLGWANNYLLDGDRTGDELALWELLYWTASRTNDALDRARRPPPRKSTLLLRRSEVA